MSGRLVIDEALVGRLPLPLAQLYRRAHNAKTPLEGYLTSYYLWEAGLKLLAAGAIVEYADRPDPDPQLAERLQNLARPALGHWWEFARRLIPVLAEKGDQGYGQARDLLLGKARDDMPRAAGLDAALREVLDGQAGARMTVRLSELFDRLVRWRNEEVGHGAAGQRGEQFYRRLGPALLAGVAEIWGRLDALAGRKLLYVAEVRQVRGSRRVDRYELTGESARRVESLDLAPAAKEPDGECVYLTLPDGAGESALRLTALHPLVIYQLETNECAFLNGRRGKAKAEYLCYNSGPRARPDLVEDLQAILARILGGPVDAVAVDAWAAKSVAEETPLPDREDARRTVGEFELLSRIGRGGMGVVYRAWQPSLGRQVALKCLLRSGDPKSEARFAREIRALGRVEHPHLVKVFTSGADGDQWFYAMELLEGADLGAVCQQLAGSSAAEIGEEAWTTALSSACEKQRQKEESLSDSDSPAAHPAPVKITPQTPSPAHLAGGGHTGRVVEIVRQVAEAAHALHEAGVVHRDIKPGNILLGPEGRHAVLMDLGLAQLSDEAEGRLTRTRQFVGTLRYASPEQILAADRLDRRADVYSLGATLWELLALRPIFGADEQMPTPDLMLKIQTTDPDRPRKHNPRVPTDLEAVVMKCLEKDRGRRYSSAAELAADLGRWQRGEPVLAQPPSLGYLLQKQIRLNRKPLTAAAAVLLAGVIGVIGAFVRINVALDREKEANNLAAKNLDQALREKAEADRLRQEAQDREKKLQTTLKELNKRLSEVAWSYCELGTKDLEKGDVRSGLDWLMWACDVVPADDPLKLSYRRLMASWPLLEGLPLVHDGAVVAVAFSPDGRLVLTGSYDKTARLWDATTGKPLGPPLQHQAIVWAVAFSPDGRTVLTGSHDKTARLWDAITGERLGPPLQHQDAVRVVAFGPDSRTVLTGSLDKTARLWDAATGKALGPPLQHQGWVNAVAFSPDGRTVLTGSDDKTARLWDTATGKAIGPPLHHQGQVNAVEFSPDGRTVLTGSKDKTARLWEAATGNALGPPLQHQDWVNAVAFSPDGRTVLTGSEDKTARLWEAATGKAIGPPLQHQGQVNAVAFSPDGRTVLTGSIDETARLWEVATGKALGPPLQHHGYVWEVAFSPDGRTVLTGSQDKTAHLWDAAGRPPGQQRPPLHHQGPVRAVAFSPDGRAVLTGSSDKTARLWDATTGKPLGPPLEHQDRVNAVAFSPDGRTVLTGSYNTVRLWDAATGNPLGVPLQHQHQSIVSTVAYGADGRTVLAASYSRKARIWDAATGKPLGPTLQHHGEVWAVAVSPDGRTVLTGGDKTGQLWEIATGKALGPPLQHDGPISAVVFSPDGRTALTGSYDKTARLWDATTGKSLGPHLQHQGAVWAVAFSPDGRTVVTGSSDKAARLWDVATGKPMGPPLQHQGEVLTVAFSPDGHMVLTWSLDKTARLWDVATGKPLGPPLEHQGSVNAVAFSPDGHMVLTGSEDKTARLWPVPAPPLDDLERLRAWVHVRTASKFDEAETLHQLSQAEWLKEWEKLKAHGGDWHERSSARTWHLAQAAEAEEEQHWFGALFHLKALIKLDGETPDLVRRRDEVQKKLLEPKGNANGIAPTSK